MCLVPNVKKISTLTHLVFAAFLVHTSTMLDRHADLQHLHKAIITRTSRHARVTVAAVRWAVQVCTGWTADRDTGGVMTLLRTRGC